MALLRQSDLSGLADSIQSLSKFQLPFAKINKLIIETEMQGTPESQNNVEEEQR